MRYSFGAGRVRISSGLQLSTCWGPRPHCPSLPETDLHTASVLAATSVVWERLTASFAYPHRGELKEKVSLSLHC